MKLFITGSTGYIGHRLAMEAAEKGWMVHALVRNINSEYCPRHRSILLFKGDVLDAASIEKAMIGCDHVFHSAGFTNEMIKTDSSFFDVNVKGTENMLQAALRNDIIKFVFTGSCSVFGPSQSSLIDGSNEKDILPTTSYSISKYKAEEIVEKYSQRGISTAIVRPSRIYGPGHLTSGNPITKLVLNALKRRIAFSPGDGSMIGNYVFIDDVVKAHFLALEKAMPGKKYIIGGENVSYNYFFQTIKRLSQKLFLTVPIHKTIFKIGGSIYNGLNSSLHSNKYLSTNLVERIWQNRALSSCHAIKDLGYTITPLEEGMFKTIEFLKNINNH